METVEVAINARGMVAIPDIVRAQMGIGPGSVLEMSSDGEWITLRVTGRHDPVSSVRGIFEREMSTDEFLNLTRGKP